MTRRAPALLLLGLAAMLTGCLGSPEGYHPGYDERPVQVKLEDAETRARRLAIPLEIIRNSAYYEVGRKEIARMMGEVPKNVFRSYEVDIDEALPPVLASRTLRRPPYYLKLIKKQAVADKEAEAEGDEEAADEEGADEDEELDEDEEDWDDE